MSTQCHRLQTPLRSFGVIFPHFFCANGANGANDSRAAQWFAIREREFAIENACDHRTGDRALSLVYSLYIFTVLIESRTNSSSKNIGKEKEPRWCIVEFAFSKTATHREELFAISSHNKPVFNEGPCCPDMDVVETRG